MASADAPEALPPCEVRTLISLPTATYLHCGHTQMRGYPLDLVPRRRCVACPQRLVPCDVPRPAPSLVRVGARLIAWTPWRWGLAIKRLIWFGTLGLLKPRPTCQCASREAHLDRLGARAARWWRALRGKV